MMVFRFPQKVLFRHCDPAGIVFYPRYFEMMNDAAEEFFSAVIGVPYEQLLKTSGVPTVQTACTFTAPSRHGDLLTIELICRQMGRSSLHIDFNATCEKENRFSAQTTLVHVDGAGKAAPWPESIRSVLQAQITEDTE